MSHDFCDGRWPVELYELGGNRKCHFAASVGVHRHIDTPLMRDRAATLLVPESARLNRVSPFQNFGRMGTVEEMGRLDLFLATEDCSFLTGQAIVGHCQPAALRLRRFRSETLLPRSL